MRTILLGLLLGSALAVAACGPSNPASSPLGTGTPDPLVESPSLDLGSPDLGSPEMSESPSMELASPSAS